MLPLIAQTDVREAQGKRLGRGKVTIGRTKLDAAWQSYCPLALQARTTVTQHRRTTNTEV